MICNSKSLSNLRRVQFNSVLLPASVLSLLVSSVLVLSPSSLAAEVSQSDIQPNSSVKDLSEVSQSDANLSIPSSSEKEKSGQEMVLEVKSKKRKLQNRSSVSRTELDQSEIEKLPQGGEVSLQKLITMTSPGVVAGPFGQFFVRGNHSSVQYLIDGVQLPDSPSGSYGQPFSPRNIDRMQVITGGIPAEYGQRLAAVVDITTKSGPVSPEGEIQLNYGLPYNTTSPHLIYGGSNTDGSFHYYFGLNYFQTNRGLDTPQPESFDQQKQGGKDAVHDFAQGNNEFGKFDWYLDNQNKLTFIVSHNYNFFEVPNYPSSFSPTHPYFGLGYRDQFGNQAESHIEADGSRHEHALFNYTPPGTNDNQMERSIYVQSSWKHTFTDHSFLQISPSYRFSLIKNGNDPIHDLATAPGGSTPIAGSAPASFAQDRKMNNVGLKADYTFRPHQDHLVKTGFQLQGAESYGWYSVQTSLNSSEYINRDPMKGVFEGVYIQDDYSISSDLVLNAGLRFDAMQFFFSDTQSRDSLLQPRLGLNYMLTPTTKLHAFYGKLFQPATIENLRAAFSRFHPDDVGVYDIKPEKSDFYEVGVAQEVLSHHVVGVNFFYKNARNILDYAQLLRTPISQPINLNEGYSYGAELSLQGRISDHWSEYMNYSYLIAKGRGSSGGAWAGHTHGNEYRFLDHSQLHTANAGLTYSRHGFWWSTQGVFGSGLHTGEDNDIALPSHLTFDTTVGYEFKKTGLFQGMRISADVLNVFDNRYPITIANAWNGNNYAAGRQYFLRLSKTF